MASPDNKPAARHPMQPDPAATPLATRQLPYSTGVWDRDEIDAVVRVLEGPRESLMIGANVAEFEEKVAALFGKQYGVMWAWEKQAAFSAGLISSDCDK